MGNRKAKTGRARKRSFVKGVKNDDLFQELKSLAEKLGLEIRHEKGDFKSGYCILKEQNLVILKKDEMLERKINIVAGILSQLDYGSQCENPAISEFITHIKKEMESTTDSEED